MTLITHPTHCPVCGDQKTFVLDAADIQRWRKGELIQNVFPEIDYRDRERLISGTCPKCWESMFHIDEEKNDA